MAMRKVVACFLVVNRPVRTRMPGGVGIAPWKAHGVQQSAMVAVVTPSQQPRTESCVGCGNAHCEA